jgi:hypothetical protein
VARVFLPELAPQVRLVNLDVARFVGGLLRGVELRVDVRDAVDELAGHHERALLAVHELAQRVRQHRVAKPAHLLGREAIPVLGAVERHDGIGDVLGFGIDRDRPVDVGLRVPLRELGFVVEVSQPFFARRVVPRVTGLVLRVERLRFARVHRAMILPAGPAARSRPTLV